MSSSTNSINNLIPKEVVKLVQNLVLVVSCKASGNLKAQEQLEKEQHEIWKEEARIAAIKAEKNRIERAKRLKRLHSPTKEETKTKEYLLARIENTTGGSKRERKKQYQQPRKEIQKLHPFIIPGNNITSTNHPNSHQLPTNGKSSYEKLLEFYTARNNEQKTSSSMNSLFEEVHLQDGAEEKQQHNSQYHQLYHEQEHEHHRNFKISNGFYYNKNQKLVLESLKNPFVRFQHSSASELVDKLTSKSRERTFIPPVEERDMHPSERHVLTDWEKMLTASSYQANNNSNIINNVTSNEQHNSNYNNNMIINDKRKIPQLIGHHGSNNTNTLYTNNLINASSNAIIQEALFPQVHRAIQRCEECSVVLPFRSGAYQQQNMKGKEILCDRCRFAFIANKRQKEVKAHISQMRSKATLLNSRESKRKRLMKLQTQQEKRRQLKQHIQESRIQHQQGHKRYVEIGDYTTNMEYKSGSATTTSNSSVSSESDNDSAKNDLLSTFDNNRTFDYQLLHSVSMSISPTVKKSKNNYFKKNSNVAFNSNNRKSKSRSNYNNNNNNNNNNSISNGIRSRKHQYSRREQKSKKRLSISDSIESKKKHITRLNPISNKIIAKGKDLRKELKQMKKDSKMERELCKKMRLQRGGKNVRSLNRGIDSPATGCGAFGSNRRLHRSSTAMAKLGKETDVMKKEREIKRRLINIASLQLDTVQYEQKGRYRRKK